MKDNALIIFAKNKIEGQVKTRLAATLGNEMAMEIYNQLLETLYQNIQFLEAEKFVYYSSFIEDDIWRNDFYDKKIQTGDDLGERMRNAFAKVFKNTDNFSDQKVILIGTDCPDVNHNILETAYEKLKDFDIVIGPALDGGYYLLGMKSENSFLFKNIKWSTDQVLSQTIEHLKENNLSYFLLPELSDIDEEKDLIHFENLDLSKFKKV
ncbi:TIGR04282 family arsenosugar biosynthesis glycosyltransferase [Halpernia sp. GG3]